MTSGTMMDKMRERVKSLYPKSEQIPFSMDVGVIKNTSIFNIQIQAGDPELSMIAANATAQVVVEENQKMFASGLETASGLIEKQIQSPLEALDRLKSGSDSPGIDLGSTDDKEPESQLTRAGQLNNVRIMDYAKIAFPIRPNKKQNAALGLLVGIFLGGGLAFFLEYLDTSIRTIEDVEKYLSWPVLGIIPRFDQTSQAKTSHSDSQPVMSKLPKSVSAESYRTLRTNIQLTNLDHPPKSLVITSAAPLEGKSTTALNLAVALAQKESKVLLIDADLRKPVIHKLLHLDNSTGLADAILNHSRLEAAVKRPNNIDNLWVLTSGSIPSNPSELLGSSRMKALMEQVTKEYDYVIFDTPPLISVSDSAILASQADGVLLVISPGKVKREIVRRTKELLERIGTPVLGCVFNGVEPSHSNYYYYYNYYRYYASPEGEEEVGKRKKKKRSL
jgi:capsular exopolysaccharide synthesis family protein